MHDDLVFMEVKNQWTSRENKIAWLLNYGRRFRTSALSRYGAIDGSTEFRYTYNGIEDLKHQGTVKIKVVEGRLREFSFTANNLDDVNNFSDLDAFIDFLVGQTIV